MLEMRYVPTIQTVHGPFVQQPAPLVIVIAFEPFLPTLELPRHALALKTGHKKSSSQYILSFGGVLVYVYRNPYIVEVH